MTEQDRINRIYKAIIKYPTTFATMCKEWETFDDDLKEQYIENIRWFFNLISSTVTPTSPPEVHEAVNQILAQSEQIEEITGLCAKSMLK